MVNVSLRNLLEAGVHFGHQTRLWNPRMKPYIYGEKNGIHIIDIQATALALVEATRFVSGVVSSGGTVLFVGTKRASRDIVASESARVGMYYVNNRWMGGTLTNFQTVKKSIDQLVNLEKARDEGRFELLIKKEALDLTRKINKMERALGGIKTMKGIPQVMFVVDPKREYIAVREAMKLGIPVVGLCDTNCNPEGITHVIPGNDDAIKSIQLFTAAIAEACVEGVNVSRGRLESGTIVTSDDADLGDVEIYRRAAQAEDGEAEAAPAESGEAEAVEEAAEEVEAAPAEATEAEAAPAEAEEAVEEAAEEAEAAEETME